MPRVVVFIDDILLSGRNQKEHDETMEAVLKRLSEVGLVVNKEKCAWNRSSVTFLGHIISEKGVAPVLSKIDAM